MRNRFLSCCSIIALLLGAGAAQAGILTSATWVQTVQVLPAAPGFPMTRTTAQLGATGTSTANSIAVSLSYPQFSTRFFMPKTGGMHTISVAWSITQGGPQAITATPSMARADQGIPGKMVARTAVHNTKGVNQSTFMSGNTVVEIPLGVGQASHATGMFTRVGPHNVTVNFYGWTAGTLTFTGLNGWKTAPPSVRFSSLPDVVAMGSFNLTPGGAGTVTLVSPSKVSIDSSEFQRRTASFASLKMTFVAVPEPGTLLLLGAGALSLALVGMRKG